MTQKHTEHEEHQHHPPKHEPEKHANQKGTTEKRHDEKQAHREAHREAHHDEHAQHGGNQGHTVKVANWEIKAENLTPQDRKYIEQYADKLSPTTLRAKWINKVGEKEDHPGQTLATRNPDVIKHWAQERSGTPATVPGTEHGNLLGVLRINFQGYGGQKLEPVSWEQWMKTFEDRKLVFLFQQEMRNGNQSNFFHMDSPSREHD